MATIKKGTYRWKDDITFPESAIHIPESYNPSITLTDQEVEFEGQTYRITSTGEFETILASTDDVLTQPGPMIIYSSANEAEGIVINVYSGSGELFSSVPVGAFAVYSGGQFGDYVNSFFGYGLEFAITRDLNMTDDEGIAFANWFNDNTSHVSAEVTEASIKAKIQSLITKANTTTGKSDTDLTNAVKSLAEGYGQGGEPWDETDPDNIIIEGEPSPDGNLIEQTFDENGVYLASDDGADGYSKVTVNVPVPEGDTLTEFLSWRNGNRLFYNLTSITTVPFFDASKITNMYSMFESCTKLTSVPLFDTSNVTNMNRVFYSCGALTEVPLFDTRKAMGTDSMFYNCSSLTTVPALDLRMDSATTSMFNGCKALTDIRIRNIMWSIQVSNGTSYGHLLTVDSLVHLIYELRKQSSTKTLTVGTANLEKLANVYVKAVDITDEMRAEDDLIDEKYPFVRCESTDEGAMLITTYASTIKNWTIK